MQLMLTGKQSRRSAIERALAATGPWERIATNTAHVSGLIEFNDSNPPLDAAFYRIVQP